MRLSTRYLWPIAEGTDPRRNHPSVVDGPRTEGIEAELIRVDDQFADLNFSLIRSGNWFTGAITVPTSTTISFGATFASPPLIHLSWYGGQFGAATTDNVTTTGATLWAAPITSTTIVRVTWLALGQKP